MVKTKLWILKFTDEGGVWATETPPNSALSLVPATTTVTSGGRSTLRTVGSRKALSSLFVAAQPLEVGDFVLAAAGQRAQIRNIFLSVTQGALARLFYVDTAEESTTPLHILTRMPEAMMEDPPLALVFSLDGVSPRLSHSDTPHLQGEWANVAMAMLRNVASNGGNSSAREVEVHADIKPGDRVVLYCDTKFGELNFNQCLIDTNIAVAPPIETTPTPHLPSSDQLMAALESLNKFQADITPLEKPVKPTTSDNPSSTANAEASVPYQYHTVYVDVPQSTTTATAMRPCLSLEGSGFPVSVCRLLTRQGFQSPSLVQASSWPLVARGGLTIIVSPPLSGKTLAYLLPLVTKRELAWSSSSCEGGIPHPRLVILVPSSWSARAVYTRASELTSALSANRRFRCCCAYKSQGMATVEVLNGVEVLVCTPTSLLGLVEKAVAHLDSLAHLVLDDYEQLRKNFSTEVDQILSLCSSSTCPVNVVVTTTQWSRDIEAIPKLIAGHTHLSCSPAHFVIACPIEATIRARMRMDVIPCHDHGPDSILKQLLNQRGCGRGIVCVATVETAESVVQYLKSLCWPVAVVLRAGGLTDIERLLQKGTVVVVADDVVPDLLGVGSLVISEVTHTEVPRSRTAFTNRLALLYPAMHRGITCCHTVLLTREWSRQAGLVKMMMDRTNQTPPQSLLDMVEELNKAKEKRRKDFDLCYSLKARGSCPDTLCSYRHTPTTSPSSFPSPHPLRLPQDGSIKVKVSHISTATRWWVCLLGHVPLLRGAEPVEPQDHEALLKMTFDLARYFTPERQRNLLNSAPAEGNYCALKDRDGCFYRVRILKFSRPLEFMFHHKEKAKVRLIDVGEARIVDVSQLLALPPHLLAPPPLVFEVFLCGVKPTDSDSNWPPQAAAAMEEGYGREAVHGRIALVSGETVWLDPVERRYILEGVNVTTALTTPQRQLMRAGMAEPNPDHLVNLSNNLGLPLVSVEPCITIDDPRISFASLSGDSVEVCVSAVDSPNWFYLQPMATESQVIEMEDSLNQYEDVAPMAGCHQRPLPVGTVCAARFSENESWYRGCVLEVEGHESRIRFLDYGNVEWVPNHMVQHIHPSALELPFQAIYCTFGMDDTKWGEDAGALLYEWTRELVLTAKVKSVSESPDRLLYGPECATVELFEQASSGGEGGGGASIALRLPADRPTQAAKQKIPPSPTGRSTLQQLCFQLCSDEDRREDVATNIKNLLSNKPGLYISGRDLQAICKLVGSETTHPSVSVPLLIILRIQAAFHSSVCVELASNHCLSYLLSLLKNSTSSQEAVTETLVLVVCLAKHIGSSSVLCTESTLEPLLCVFRDCGDSPRVNSGILHPLISVLHHITTSHPDLLAFAAKQGVVPLLCGWLTHASSLPPSSSSPSSSSIQSCVVQFVLGMLGDITKLSPHLHDVSQTLSLDSLSSLLANDSSVKMICAILRLLVPLCDLHEFGARLYSSSLLVTLFKLPMTASIAILLHKLKSNMEPIIMSLNSHPIPLTNQISPLDILDQESLPLPPLIESGEDPLVPSGDEVPSTRPATDRLSISGESKLRRGLCQQLEDRVLHPRVLWSQRQASVLLAVQLRGCQESDTTANFTPTTVSFRTRVWNQDYRFSVNLFAPIDPEECSLSLTGSEALLKLLKSVPGTWPRLHSGDDRLVHVSVDFDRWEDEELGVLGANNVPTPNWRPPPTTTASKTTPYVNPVLTESDLDSDETGSDSRGREEEGEAGGQVWQDDLDMGFHN